MMLMIVTTIPAIPTVSSIVKYTMYLSLYFPSVSPPRYWKSSKRKTFWRKANRYPFEITLIFVSYTKSRTEYTKLEEKTNKIQNIYTDKWTQEKSR